MTAILKLQFSETVRLDRGQLEVLYHSLGPIGADKIVEQGLEGLSVGLSGAGEHYRRGELEALRVSLRSVIGHAQQLGMTLLAGVARDVVALSQSFDSVAFAAAMARLERIGEGSLLAVWDLQDMSV